MRNEPVAYFDERDRSEHRQCRGIVVMRGASKDSEPSLGDELRAIGGANPSGCTSEKSELCELFEPLVPSS